MEDKYPKLISNQPCKVDLFDGKPQEKVAKAIAEFIFVYDKPHKTSDTNKKTKCLNPISRIIGLEGGWGSGKSNVIGLLGKELPNYYVFEYDAWGHQEDLQRRSFLESLTAKLLKPNDAEDGKLLRGKARINDSKGNEKEIEWAKALQLLLARKVETEKRNFPKMSVAVIISIFLITFTPIASSVAESQEFTNWWCTLFVSSIPFLLVVSIWLIACIINWKLYWTELFKYFDQENIDTTTYETISETEPSVNAFVSWMRNLDTSLTKKLIIVFDNMDRLPKEKVKQLWSSIHTFFSEGEYDNIWVLIPYDKNHLMSAFDEKEENMTHFIKKSFPIVYRVAPPIFTDLKNAISQWFAMAFGNNLTQEQGEERDLISRIFRLKNHNPSARDIISFINEMVVLKQMWKDVIPLKYIALFVLLKDEIFNEKRINENNENIALKIVADNILGGSYLIKDKIDMLMPNTDEQQQYISSLVYEIEIEKAKTLPMRQFITASLSKDIGQFDLITYSLHRDFISVLEECIREIDPVKLDNVVATIGNYCESQKEDNPTIPHSIFKELSKLKKSEVLKNQEFDNTLKVLLLNANDSEKEVLIKDLYNKCFHFEQFSGGNYYSTLKSLEDFLTSINSAINIDTIVKSKQVESKIFIEYVIAADKNYKKYKLQTNPDGLDKYFANLLPEKLKDVVVISTLVNDEKNEIYKFPILLKGIEDVITKDQITIQNFEAIYTTYKLFSKGDKLNAQLTVNHVTSLFAQASEQQDSGIFISPYYDLAAMMITNGNNVGFVNDNQVSSISSIIEYYANYGDLLVNCTVWNIPLLNKVLSYMTTNQKGTILEVEKILPLFETVKANLGINEAILFEQLNRWWQNTTSSINKGNIQTFMPQHIMFSYSIVAKNDLTDYINKTAVEAIAEIEENKIYSNGVLQNNYWVSILSHLINSYFITPLPANLTSIGKQIYKDIAMNRIPIPISQPLLAMILGKLDKRKIGTTIIEIINSFCNGETGYEMTSQKFLFFEELFKKQKNTLQSRAGVVTSLIIKPILPDSQCRNKILSDKDFYATIINSAGDNAEELRADITSIIESNKDDTELKTFAQLIRNKRIK